jgi:phosphoenolpyruvate carboxylase
MLDRLNQETPLREEITNLGKMLGDTIREIAGDDALKIVEKLRRLAWDSRSGQPGAEQILIRLIASLRNDQLSVVITAFSIFLDLINLAEDRERVRVLHARKRNAYPHTHSESIHESIERIAKSGTLASKMQLLLDKLHIELVFTAHPTESKRRAVREKLRRIRELLSESDAQQLPPEHERTQRQIRTELAKLWQTDFIRPWRPSVMQEVERGLSIKPVLWEVLPQILGDMRGSLAKVYPKETLRVQTCVTFGSWIGGDRDGHPGVTPEITQQTLVWSRQAVLELHLSACDNIFASLSLSERRMRYGNLLSDPISRACKVWPPLEKLVSKISPDETCRRWIAIIRWRLEQTQKIDISNNTDIDVPAGAYALPSELTEDISVLLDTLTESPGGEFFIEEIRVWLDRVDVFGFHLARLDVRQDARQYKKVLNELFQKLNLCATPELLEESERQTILLDTLGKRCHVPSQETYESLSPAAKDALKLFQLLHRVVKSYGVQALGGHVISMASAPSDVLTVLWLWQLTELESDLPQGSQTYLLPIIPLFETIEDLEQGPAILASLFDIKQYREYLHRQEDCQIVMIGYSDSTKCGGYLSACWSLYEAQQKLHDVAASYGVKLTFFHGRGGSLGRGGGPAARGILSLPAQTFDGSLRLTEQGEVLSDRYDDPIIAHRHLEQVIWSSLLAIGEPKAPDKQDWSDLMKQLAETSYRKYRDLIEQPQFIEFFRQATPITEIEQLPIGSRPARRGHGGSLSDLRAIPWVFSWTQCRCLIPAWYGIGYAVDEFLHNTELQGTSPRKLLQSMYREWPFFRATIDSAELALTKTDLVIAEQYATLTENSDALKQIESMITDEFRRSRDAILLITENNELMDSTPWLKESIRMRNRYIDPLNLIQVELLRRSRSCTDAEENQIEELRHLSRLTINGLVAGMRTSG